ncbi:Ger(x)C family spore germination protein [Ectobacillus funiculus]|uniref:Ger(x)C family spore germination protein n=1 Tax=Ectobacillus funiculus TaxID=137993 RepID=UPI00397DD839
MRILLFVLIWASILPLTGCWDRTELNDVALIRGMGLDQKDNNRIEVTAEIYLPQMQGSSEGGGKSSGGQTIIRTGQGITIADALQHLQERIPREVFWGHSEVILIGEKLAKKGIRDKIDFFLRDPRPRLRAYVFVTKGRAKDVLALLPPIEKSSAEVLRELAVSEVLMHVTLIDLLQMLKGDAAALPMVDILPPEKGKDSLETIAYINRTAVFKEDKMIGDINDKVTRGVLWFRDQIKRANITVKSKEVNGPISLTIIRTQTKTDPQIEDGKWKINVKIVTESDVILNESDLELEKPENVRLLKNLVRKSIEKRLTVTINQVQKEMKTDILNFAAAFERKYPNEWNKVKGEWNELFPEVEVRFDIETHILRTGAGSAT